MGPINKKHKSGALPPPPHQDQVRPVTYSLETHGLDSCHRCTRGLGSYCLQDHHGLNDSHRGIPNPLLMNPTISPCRKRASHASGPNLPVKETQKGLHKPPLRPPHRQPEPRHKHLHLGHLM